MALYDFRWNRLVAIFVDITAWGLVVVALVDLVVESLGTPEWLTVEQLAY